MRVGIVGAGAAGLAAARELRGQGHAVVVFEKSRGFGGRIATRRVGPYTFDTGATSIAPRGKSIEQVMLHELDTSELILVEKPIYVHQYGRIFPGDMARSHVPRYTYVSGNTKFAKLLAEGLDVRLEATVDRLRSKNGEVEILGEAFDAVILTPPIPQSEELLATIGETRRFANVRYRPCLSVLLGFAAEMPEVRYHAIIDTEQRHPLTWLSLESVKCPFRAPAGHTAMVAQLGPAYSRQFFESPDTAIIEDTVAQVERLYGPAFSVPDAAEVKRWRYSQPETTTTFESVNRPGSRVVIASDGVTGGRVELAYEAGVMAAKLLSESVTV